APMAAVVNQAFVRRAGIGDDPVGRHLRIAGDAGRADTLYVVVGVTTDAKYERLSEDLGPILYSAASQDDDPDTSASILVRSSAPPADVVDALKRTMAEAAPAATLDFQWLAAHIRDSLRRERLLATLSEVFGGVAALLAVIGLYGVIAYSVARRTREIGI